MAKGLPYYQAGGRGKLLIKPADIDQFLARQQRHVPDLNRLIDEVMQKFGKSPQKHKKNRLPRAA
jgi:hypothetical protein